MRRSVTINGRRVRSETTRNYLGSIVPLNVAQAFDAEARQRKSSRSKLVRRALTAIVNGRLFKAVLDE